MFTYTPLPSSSEEVDHHIRVLDLFPSTDPAKPIHGRLRQVSLNAAHRSYEALSYVWGPESHEHKIMIANEGDESSVQPMSIRKNLYEALSAMRRTDKVYTVWADRISINQDDVTERNSQVGLMGLVYWHAAAVQIWLGSNDSHQARNAFDEMIRRCAGFFTNRQEMPTLTESDMDSVNRYAWKCISTLYRGEWFNRAWVQQEIGLSGAGDFWWGHERMPINRFCEFFLWLESDGALFKRLLDVPISVQETIMNWINYGRATRPHWSGPDTKSFNAEKNFLFILACGYSFRASDPRDHVYAFLGHPSSRRAYAYQPNPSLQYDQVMRQDSQPIVVPDYTKSVEDVLFETAHALLHQHRDLTPLGAVHHDNDSLRREYPSWVPRWAAQGTPYGLGIIPHQQSWNASLVSPTPTESIFKVASDRSLIVRAVLIDEVHSRSENPQWLTPGGLDKITFDKIRANREFFFTTGHRPMLGPKVTETCDIIAILMGSYAPCVLRPSGSDYIFIGNAIVKDMMRGEALRITPQPIFKEIRLV